eukprot:767908-Hanusia_phi.AAC.1
MEFSSYDLWDHFELRKVQVSVSLAVPLIRHPARTPRRPRRPRPGTSSLTSATDDVSSSSIAQCKRPCSSSAFRHRQSHRRPRTICEVASVSYTHLTLPTICSV